ncbi:aliphatic sulfonate ABC transporter substrate-binding protein [Spirillospora sp. CA-294931]|uniref:aliphatic sulfonate ABC transporter substrate-binding protein n=1 Tax=Spirillospora sp. CA-294931 TaxID=3240042 RepID=UPI003D8EAE49
MRTSKAVLAAMALLGPLLTGCSDSDDDGAVKVRFGYNSDFNGASLLAVAGKRGLWKKHGLKADTKSFTNGPLQIQALGAGDLDYGYVGPGALWLPATGRAKIIAINSLGFADRLIAKPGITDVASLKGKKVGVPEGTSGDMVLRLALERAGMTIKDVNKVPMDPSTVVSAFSAGQIDAAGIWYPLVDTVKKRVPKLVELAKNADFYPGTSFPTAFVSATKADPATTAKVLKVIQEANDHRAAHPDEAVAATAKFLKIPEPGLKAEAANIRLVTSAELARQTRDGTIGRWLHGLQRLFVAFGKLREPVDPATFYAGDQYVQAVQPK